MYALWRFSLGGNGPYPPHLGGTLPSKGSNSIFFFSLPRGIQANQARPDLKVRSMALFPRREWAVPPPFGGPSAIQGQQFYIFLFVAPWHPSEPGPSDIEE